jgi:hypothetical protein
VAVAEEEVDRVAHGRLDEGGAPAGA